MLYNEQWSKPKVQADVFSLESLVAWLETMPADGIYCYTDTGRCLLATYFRAMEEPFMSVGPVYYSDGYGDHYELPKHFNDIAVGPNEFHIPRDPEWTYGRALSRARKALAS